MGDQERIRDYYFDDKKAPDGPRRYRLSRQGQSLGLFRETHRKWERVHAQPKVLRVLEYLVRAGGLVERAALADPPLNCTEPEQYIKKVRVLLNDLDPWRLVQKADTGDIVFGVPVRDTPSAYEAAYRTELRVHWKPRAMGSSGLFQGEHWYFSGRTAALRRIVHWLAGDSSRGQACVVTGDPGAGKSAVLGYLVTCSDREERQRPTTQQFLGSMPEGTIPSEGCADFAINLRDRTLDSVLAALADSFGCEHDRVIAELANLSHKTVLVFDGLDEAAEPTQIAETLLRSLTGYDHLWLIVGARRPEVPRLGSSVFLLDLTAPEFQGDTDLAIYVERILLALGETRTSSYRANRAAAKAAANAVAHAANGNFLVAFIIARYLLEARLIPYPETQSFPRTPKDAFEEYLRRLGERSGLGYGRLRQALIPLAYAQGTGLPRETWATLAEDMGKVLDIAAAFISEHEQDSHTVYRLYHQALVDTVREGLRDSEQHRTIAETLIAAANHDWFRAGWYTQTYLAVHAAAGGVLDELLCDTRFLAVADPTQLVSVTLEASSRDAQRRAKWYRLAAEHSRIRDVRFASLHSDLADRLSYLALSAVQAGAADLASSTVIVDISRRWYARWARWVPVTPHLALVKHLRAPCILSISGQFVASACRHNDVTISDWRTGQRLATLHTPAALWDVILKENVLVTAGNNFVQAWDWRNRKLLWQAETHRTSHTLTMAGRYLACGNMDGSVQIWDWPTGNFVRDPWNGYGVAPGDDRFILAPLSFVGDLIVCANVRTGTLYHWDVETGRLVREQQFDTLSPPEAPMARMTDFGFLFRSPDGSIKWCRLPDGEAMGEPIPCQGVSELSLGDAVAIGTENGTIRLRDFETAADIGDPLRGPLTDVHSLAVSKDVVVSGGRDCIVRVWDRSTLFPPNLGHADPLVGLDHADANSGVDSIVLTGNILAVGTRDGRVHILDPSTGRVAQELKDPFCNSKGCFVTANETLVLAHSSTGEIAAWSRATGDRIAPPIRQGAAAPTKSLLLSDNLLIEVATDETISLWDSRTAKPILSFDRDDFRGLAVAATRNTLAAGDREGYVRLCQLRHGRIVGKPTVIYQPDNWTPKEPIDNIAVSDKFVYFSTGEYARVYDRKTNREICFLPRYSDEHFGPLVISGNTILCGLNNNVVVWDAMTRGKAGIISVGSPVHCIAAKNSALFVGCSNGLLRIDFADN